MKDFNNMSIEEQDELYGTVYTNMMQKKVHESKDPNRGLWRAITWASAVFLISLVLCIAHVIAWQYSGLICAGAILTIVWLLIVISMKDISL